MSGTMTSPFPTVVGPADRARTADTPATSPRILAHRGVWTDPAERNTLAAFERAFHRGWGAEIDVRDLDGELVVSHDPPRAGALPFAAVVAAHEAAGTGGTLAINIKADGLHAPLADALAGVPAERWFAFDMSVPDAVVAVRRGLPIYTRHSDVEREPVLYAAAGGVWLDDFAGGFITEARVAAHLDAGKHVAVVSPELHGRDHAPAWREWRTWSVWRHPAIALCTDLPDHALEALR
jgi:glycerophosphoryl diester phosphodiesterase